MQQDERFRPEDRILTQKEFAALLRRGKRFTAQPGRKGPQGPRGQQEAARAEGAKGPRGQQGAARAEGAKGPRGQQGAARAKGAKGPRGQQGAARAKGASRGVAPDYCPLQFIYAPRRPEGQRTSGGEQRSRLGLIVSRKVGKANKRNRIKRLVRELFRIERKNFERPIDLVVRAVGPAATAMTYNEVKREFQRFTEVMTRRS